MTTLLRLTAGLAVYALLVLVLLRLFRRFGEDQPAEPISHVRVVTLPAPVLHAAIDWDAQADEACALTEDHDPRCLSLTGLPDARHFCDCRTLRLIDLYSQPDADRLRLISGGEGTA